MDINQQIKSALEKIAERPWTVFDGMVLGKDSNAVCAVYGGWVNLDAENEDNSENAHFIANAPTWLSHQATEIERLTNEQKEADREHIERMKLLGTAIEALSEIATSNTGLASKLKTMAMKSISEIQEVSKRDETEA